MFLVGSSLGYICFPSCVSVMLFALTLDLIKHGLSISLNIINNKIILFQAS
jgi:hypothetical protein